MGRLTLAQVRSVLVAGVAAVCLMVGGCAAGDISDGPRPRVLDLLDRPQEHWDHLPPGSPALLVTVPGSSRSMGGSDLHEFFIARGLSAKFCVVAVDIYDVELGHACGGDAFGGELADGMRFEFGAFYAQPIPRAEWEIGLNPHFSFSLDSGSREWSAELVAIMARAQVASDIPPHAESGSQWQDLDSFRLLTVDGDTSFFVALAARPGALVCVTSHTEGGEGSSWGSGGCGFQDVVIASSFSSEGSFGALTAHFSAAGFEGEAPAGWRQVSPLLRVKEPDAS